MRNYLDLMKQVQSYGYDHPDRTGTGRRSSFGHMLKFKMEDGFPLVTTRKIYTKAIIEELLWFISGSDSITPLNKSKVNIWNKWAVEDKDIDDLLNELTGLEKETGKNIFKDKLKTIGPIYGPNWRNAPQTLVNFKWPTIDIEDIPEDKLKQYRKNYEMSEQEVKDKVTEDFFCKISYKSTVDQLNNLIVNLKKRPFSSRHVVTAWIPELIPFEGLTPQENVLLDKGALAPCHYSFQCLVKPRVSSNSKHKLSLLLNIRSSDVPVGLPYNISQYALLLHMLAQVTSLEADELIVSIGDAHIYKDQLDKVDIQLGRSPLPLPSLKLNEDIKSIYDFTSDDIEILNYQHHDPIDYPVSI